MYRLLKRGLFIMVVWGLPVVCVVLWAVSMCRLDTVGVRDSSRMITLTNAHANITAEYMYLPLMHQLGREPAVFLATTLTFSRADDSIGHHGQSIETQWRYVLGDAYWHRDPAMLAMKIPWWTITLITLLPAMFIYFPGRRKRRRRKLGLCTRCGYDLRGQSDDSRGCPECGTAC